MRESAQDVARGTMMGGETDHRSPTPCAKHDSIRLDCWVDTHCLRCGHHGYWIDGELIAENSVDAIAKGHLTRGHPCGKTLISQDPALEASDAV